jgi:hypothetical protein
LSGETFHLGEATVTRVGWCQQIAAADHSNSKANSGSAGFTMSANGTKRHPSVVRQCPLLGVKRTLP